MDDQHHDRVFFVTFGGVVGFLGAFTVAIMVIANVISHVPAEAEASSTKLEERIKPVGQVITDPAALLKVSAPAASARAPMSGADVVAKVCSACHGAGLLGAPKIGDKSAWSARKSAAGGVEGLVKSAGAGKNSMPPRGGDPSLSDSELKSAIEQMLKQTGV